MVNSTIKKTAQYTVTQVPRENLAACTTPGMAVVTAPNYNPETDEPAFQKAWQVVNEKQAKGQLNPVPVLPDGGVRLRGSRAKRPA